MTGHERNPQPDVVVRFFADAGAAIGLILVAILNVALCVVLVELARQGFFTLAALLYLIANILAIAGSAALAVKRRWSLAYGLLLMTVPACVVILLLNR
jgi:hypothetical protein